MKRLVFIVIGVILVGGGAYLAYKGIYLKSRGKKFAVLSVNTLYPEAGVFIDNNFMGPTPFFKDDLQPGVRTVRVGDWVGKVTLTPAALTVINQDLGPTNIFTAGEIIWLEKTPGKTSLAIISTPDEADVRVDGEKIGETPLVTANLTSGDHKVTIAKQLYITREIRLRVQDGHKLNVNVQLMFNPLPEEVGVIGTGLESLMIRDFSMESEQVLDDAEAWVKGASFYLKGYEAVSEVRVDYFLDFEGNFYEEGADLVSIEEIPKEEKLVIGYLGKKEDGGLSSPAVAAINRLVEKSLPEPEKKPQIEIVPTGTGWLRVRSRPGLGNLEIAKVNVGEKFELLGEESGWYKIKLSDGQEGWISGQYARKVE